MQNLESKVTHYDSYNVQLNQTSLDPYVKSILYDSKGLYKSWGQGIGKALTLTYSFKLFARGHQRLSSAFPLSDENRGLVLRAMRRWESYANIHFVQDNNNPSVVFLETQHPSQDTSAAYVSYIQRTPPFSTSYTHYLLTGADFVLPQENVRYVKSGYGTAKLLSDDIHEVGHLLSLQHPHTSLYKHGFLPQTTVLSNMNYNSLVKSEFRFMGIHIGEFDTHYIPISPCIYDIMAAHELFGPNPTTHQGNDTYDLIKRFEYAKKLSHVDSFRFRILFTFVNYKTMETIWDPCGVDTLLIDGAEKDVLVNLNSGNEYHTKIDSHDTVLFGEFEDAILSHCKGNNVVVTNALNNVITLDSNEGATTLIVSPERMGHDIAFGFNPARDTIRVEKLPEQSASLWNIKMYSGNYTDSASSTYSGTRIEFNENNSIFLVNVASDEINEHTIKVDEVTEETALHKDNRFLESEELPEPSFQDSISTFTSAALYATGTTVLTELVYKCLIQQGFTVEQANLASRVIQFTSAFMTGSWASLLASHATTKILSSFGFSKENTYYASMVASTIATVGYSSSLPGMLNLAAGAAGSCGGVWIGKKIVSNMFSFFSSPKIQRCLTNSNNVDLEIHALTSPGQKKDYKTV
jgi:hypothetical protein